MRESFFLVEDRAHGFSIDSYKLPMYIDSRDSAHWFAIIACVPVDIDIWSLLKHTSSDRANRFGIRDCVPVDIDNWFLLKHTS